MPNTSKTFKIITGSALALSLVIAGGTSVSAATQPRAHNTDSLVTAIATRFNLNTADVQKVFEENRMKMETQMHTERTTKEAERLRTAVVEGKLTQAQADLITAKRVELEAERKAQRAAEPTLTNAERKTAMEAHRTELQTWMTANNIPQQFMMMGVGHGGFKGVPTNPKAN